MSMIFAPDPVTCNVFERFNSLEFMLWKSDKEDGMRLVLLIAH
jgi:hypothetical protein